MFVEGTISTDDVVGWIESDAEAAADSYKFELEEYGKSDLNACVNSATEGRFDWPKDALTMILYYDWSAHARGVDYEDSAVAQFDDDVYERAKQMLEDEGYDVSDL